jgi:hypothetical protein
MMRAIAVVLVDLAAAAVLVALDRFVRLDDTTPDDDDFARWEQEVRV